MRIKPTTNFQMWCDHDNNLIDSKISYMPMFKEFDAKRLTFLTEFGISHKALIQLFGEISFFRYSGFARFRTIRFILWYWGNGDKILYPLNSNGELYIGSDHKMWCDMWPFLQHLKGSVYDCNLPEYGPFQYQNVAKYHEKIWLGGQSHFGHFIANFVAPLLRNNGASEVMSKRPMLFVPIGYKQLHRDIIAGLTGNEQENIGFHELYGPNGIYEISDIIVPAISESIDAIERLQGRLERKNLNRPVRTGKKVFISRSPIGDSDRIYESLLFATSLRDMGFEIIDALNHTFEDRLKILGDSDWILTETGSCSLNAYLFGNTKSLIRTFIPHKVLNSPSHTVMNMLQPVVSQMSKGNFIPLESCDHIHRNGFYSVCIPPTIDQILHSFETSVNI